MSEIKLSVDGIEYEPTGKCCVEGNDIVIRYGMHQIIFKPKEKDIPKDWEVLYFTWNGEGYKLKDETYFDANMNIASLSFLLQEAGWNKAKIHSVKRLTDNSIFTIGDYFKYHLRDITVPISEFKIFKDDIMMVKADTVLGWMHLKDITKRIIPPFKPKEPLFTKQQILEFLEKNLDG